MSETSTATAATNNETAAATDAKSENVDELGEGGVKALTAERDARKAAEKQVTDLAKQLKALTDKDKSETEKQQEELETTRKELEALTTAKTRAEVAADKAVPTALLAGPASNSAEDIAAFADALLAFRGEQVSTRLTASREGNSPTKHAGDEHEFVKNLFGAVD